MRFEQRLLTIVFSAAMLGYPGSAASQQFTQSCDSPSYPQPAPTANLDVDNSCGIEGSGGKEANQNQAKNNFCAQGPAKPITIERMTRLQNTVANNAGINFGRQNTATRKAGPTQNRTKLEKLGEGDLVALQGFVKIARQEGGESVNCGKSFGNEALAHDIHISIVSNNDDSECDGVVVEMSPHHRPDTWTKDNVEAVATASLSVRVTGQLFFDSSHNPCERGKASSGNPARVSLWEIHPIYQFQVCSGSCQSDVDWVDLDAWVKQNSAGQ